MNFGIANLPPSSHSRENIIPRTFLLPVDPSPHSHTRTKFRAHATAAYPSDAYSWADKLDSEWELYAGKWRNFGWGIYMLLWLLDGVGSVTATDSD
jgi:hypothetical protein